MPRSYMCTALTLRVRPSGESDREAWFLTAGEGIIKATVFGGPKSRLRARVAPFHGGTLWVYRDPVRDFRKVSDFDVDSYRPGIRELWERAATAGAVAETILASHGGGGAWQEALDLAGGVLDGLGQADAPACGRLGVYFFWHWAGILGLRPEISACSACARGPDQSGALWYSAVEGALFCGHCMENAGRNAPEKPAAGSWVKAGPGARAWLKKAETVPPSGIARVTLDTASLEQARALSQAVLAGALGRRLLSWEAS